MDRRHFVRGGLLAGSALGAGVLAQLEAEANWRRIAGEWWMGDAPATELGRAEAAFWSRRRR